MELESIGAAPIVNLLGERVALGPLRREHLPLLVKWQNDFEVTRTLRSVRPFSDEALDRAFDQAIGATDQVHFTIFERATLQAVGGCNLLEITKLTATFNITIGEKSCWGKGYGTEATRLTLDYGFQALGLHNIMLTVYSFNERGSRAYRRAGFREIGRRREALERGGRLHDIIFMDCLATDFQSLGLQQILLGEPAPANRDRGASNSTRGGESA